MAWERVKSVRIGGRAADLYKDMYPGYGRSIKYDVTFRQGDNYVEPRGQGFYTKKAALQVARESAKNNPASRVGGKGVTLRNMASITIKRLPGGAVAVTGRKLGGARRANPRRQRKSAKR